MDDYKKFEGIDLFCGAGGVTTGIEQARYKDQMIARVICAINHDENALASHAKNHLNTIHFPEDIRNFDVKKLPDFGNRKNKLIYLWASLECTNFSNAKGGLPRDADSRTLANSLFPYVVHVNPDYIFIENVREFMAWGPLDNNGKPLSRKNGLHYLAWVEKMCSYGYDYDWKLLNSADYGAHTSRIRYFAIFSKKGLPVRWPEATHSKKPNGLKKWKPVREVLDLHEEGNSIFTRKKPLVEKTLKRIYAGLQKYVSQDKEENWIVKYLSNDPRTGVNAGASVDNPAPSITTQSRLYLAKTKNWMDWNYTGEHHHQSIDKPCRTITTKPQGNLMHLHWLDKRYRGSHNHQSIEDPAGSITTNPKFVLMSTKWINKQWTGKDNHQSIDQPAPVIASVNGHSIVTADQWLDKQFSGSENHQSVDVPAGSLTTNPKFVVMTAAGWVMPTNYSNNSSSLDKPIGTVTANRKWHYLISPLVMISDAGQVAIKIDDDDSPTMIKIKKFMAEHGIVDIKMRMLNIPELKRITGLPEDYKLLGSKSDQKKFIGNAVTPVIPQKMIECLFEANNEIEKPKSIINLPLFKSNEARQ